MQEKFELELPSRTTAAGADFAKALDAQIMELELRLDQLKTLRGNVARTFGIDRNAKTPMGQMLEGANRSTFEGAGKPLSLESDIARELATETDRALGLDPGSAKPLRGATTEAAMAREIPGAKVVEPPMAIPPAPKSTGSATG